MAFPCKDNVFMPFACVWLLKSLVVTEKRSNMKNKLIPLWDKIMLRKRYIIECINHLLKDKGNLVHSRHRSINNFLMNLIATISAYCFFDNKPEAIKGYCVEDNKQLTLF